MTFQQWLTQAIVRLSQSESPRRDAEILLGHVTGKARTYILAFGETALTAAQAAELETLLSRRARGEPVAHLVGQREFWSLPLFVSPATLIPRPDTECLVEQTLARLSDKPCRILDLGTGTGAIALALASERPDCHVTAVDVMPDAVALAARNAEHLAIPNVRVLQSHWFSALAGQQFDIIVGNPPYIDETDPHLAQGDVRFEPKTALVAARWRSGRSGAYHPRRPPLSGCRRHDAAGTRLDAGGSGARNLSRGGLWRYCHLSRLRRQRASDARAIPGRRMNLFNAVLYLHIACVVVSVSLFVLRYWWSWSGNRLLDQRWVRIAPHCSDTLLFLSGAGLMAITHYLPFTEEGTWLTEKLFGVIIYIALGFIALGRRRQRSQQSRFVAFLLALVVLFIIIQLAITRTPLLG